MPPNPADFIGRKATFDHKGKRVTGIITEAAPADPWGKGRIPDYSITVRGSSGVSVTVSMVETYLTISDQ